MSRDVKSFSVSSEQNFFYSFSRILLLRNCGRSGTYRGGSIHYVAKIELYMFFFIPSD